MSGFEPPLAGRRAPPLSSRQFDTAAVLLLESKYSVFPEPSPQEWFSRRSSVPAVSYVKHEDGLVLEVVVEEVEAVVEVLPEGRKCCHVHD